MGNVNMEAYQVHYRGDESVADHLRQLDLDVEKAAVLPDLPTAEGKTVLTAVTDSQGDTELTYEAPEVEGEDIAPAFSEETAYSEGDLVYYDGILYKYTADHAAGAWDPSEVTQTTVAAEFNQLKNTLTSVEDTLDEVVTYSGDTFSLTGFVAPFLFQKIGRIVFLTYNGDANSVPVGGLSFSEVVPEKYRPAEKVSFYSLALYGTSTSIMLRFSKEGVIDGYNYGSAITAATTCRFGTISYVAVVN